MSKSQRADHKERVQRGMEFLDYNLPGWEAKIDLKTLNLERCSHCILGQLYDDYFTGSIRLGLTNSGDNAYYGFDSVMAPPWVPVAYGGLTQEWKTRIQARVYGLSDMDEVWFAQKGEEAYNRDFVLAQNPYQPDTAYALLWEEGWYYAHEENSEQVTGDDHVE